LNSFLQRLAAGGYRITPQRRLILEVLQQGARHQTAEDICASLQQKEPNISLGTVYRNLNILISLGLVTGVDFKDGRIRYELNDSHHHHLVCLNCGNTVEFPGCNLEETLGDIIGRTRFKITGHILEVFGYCRACQEPDGR